MPFQPSRFRSAARRLFFASPLYSLTLGGRPAESLAAVLPDAWPGDSEAGAALLEGAYPWAGRSLPLGADWSLPAQGPEAEVLHGFAWLTDLHARGTPAARRRAQALVAGWMARHDRWGPVAWRADVLGARLGRWFTAADFLFNGAEDEFRAAFVASAGRQARHLRRAMADAPRDHRIFQALKGLIYADICLGNAGNGTGPSAGLRLLEREIVRQILPDGGHFERSPAIQVEVIRRLVDIRAALAAHHVEAPAALQGAIDRAVPMLRCFRMGDGRLAVFNGGGEETADTVDLTLAQAGVRGKAILNAPHVGFQRMQAGRTALIVDTGTPPPHGADRRAHAGTLSFEMTVGRERLIVNCGDPGPFNPALGAALRATAAHSTLVVNDTHSSEFRVDGSLGRRPTGVACQRREAEGATWVEASHDGYGPTHGLVHRRTLYLDAEGTDLRGEDRLIPAKGRSGAGAFTVRFHLAPGVHASMASGGNAVFLRLERGGGWRFSARGGALALEESLYAGDPRRPRRSEQIVLRGLLQAAGDTVAQWALRREGSEAPDRDAT